MTSICSTIPQYSRFENRVLGQLSNDILSGAISATDGSSIASALGDIQQQLLGSKSTTGATAPQKPGDIRQKVNALIDGEVTSGKLTTAQADELKKVLSGGRGGPNGAGGPNGMGGPNGPPPVHGGHHGGGKKNDGDDASSTTDTSSTGSSGTTSGSTAASDSLAMFLKVLQDAQKKLQTSSYGASGTFGAPVTTASARVLDTVA